MATTKPKTKELRGLPEAELRSQLQALRQELWELRVKARDGSLQQTHLLLGARRQAARVHTVLREQAAAAEKPSS